MGAGPGFGPESGLELDGMLARCSFPPAGTPLVCGVSGGADSMGLLVLATAAGCQVTAAHVDHGLRPGSHREAALVAAAAARFGASFRTERVAVAAGSNLEARARQARLAALGPGAATGHTADDQAETMLLNLLRGAGLDGLAGMRPGPAHPVLALRRAELAALCARLGLEVVEDPSNRDPAFLRNRVRHELLPLMSELAGRDLVPVLVRQAGLMRDDVELLDSMAGALAVEDASALAGAPIALARRRIRQWLRPAGPKPPHPPDLATVERVLAVARLEAKACDVGGGRQVRRSAGRLRLVDAEEQDGPPGR